MRQKCTLMVFCGVGSPHKGPIMRKAFPCHDVIVMEINCHLNKHDHTFDVCHYSSMPWLHRQLAKPMMKLTLSSSLHHTAYTLQWRFNGRDSVSNHQPHNCLLNRLFRRRSKKTSKLRVTGLCEGNSPGTGEFPAQRASYAENASIWWRHHVSIEIYRWAIIEELSIRRRLCIFLISWGQKTRVKHCYVELSSWYEFWFAIICISNHLLMLF